MKGKRVIAAFGLWEFSAEGISDGSVKAQMAVKKLKPVVSLGSDNYPPIQLYLEMKMESDRN